MQIFGRIFDHFKDINPSTLSGAIDVIVVEDVETGELSCSPFHVRFGKLQVLKPADKKVEIEVNGRLVETGPSGIGMKIGLAGETFFVIPVDGPVPSEYLTSPLVEPIKPSIEPPKISLSPEKSTKSIEGTTGGGREGRRSQMRVHLSDSEAAAGEAGEEDWTWKWGDLPERHETGSAVPSRSSSPKVTEAIERIIQVQRVDGDQPESDQIADKSTAQRTENTDARTDQGVDQDELKRLENDILESVSMTPVKATKAQSTESTPVKNSTPNPSDDQKEAPVSLKDHLSKKDVVTMMYDHLVALVSEALDDIEIELCLLPTPLQVLPSIIQVYEEMRPLLTLADFDAYQASPEDHLANGIFIVRSSTSPKSCMFLAKGGIQLLIGLRLYKRMLSLERFLSLCDIQAEPPPIPPRSSWRQWWSSPRSQSITAKPTDNLGPLKPPSGSMSLEPASPGKPLPPLSNLVRASSSPDLTPAPSTVNYSKSLRLPSDELKRWGLAYGMNTIKFNVVTSKNGKATCTARLFLWRSDDKVVISDIDGTITKSDALGHLFQFVGKDWTHSGIANLFTDIARNGYRFMYLTSRAIGQADSTRDYLKGIEQDRYQLPEGPVIMSPDRFFTAVRREVIEGVPEQFKIPCLLDIRRLFTKGTADEKPYSMDPMCLTEAEKSQPCPFYAGFGNRHTDAMSYAAVGIVPARIYIVNPESHLSLQIVTGYRSTYGKLVDLVDYVFPPLNDAIDRHRHLLHDAPLQSHHQHQQHPQQELQVDSETFNDFYFWRQPLALPERPHLPSSSCDLLYSTPTDSPADLVVPDHIQDMDQQDDDDDDGESVERNDQYYFEKEEEAGLIPFA